MLGTAVLTHAAALGLGAILATPALAQEARFDHLADLPLFRAGRRPTPRRPCAENSLSNRPRKPIYGRCRSLTHSA